MGRSNFPLRNNPEGMIFSASNRIPAIFILHHSISRDEGSRIRVLESKLDATPGEYRLKVHQMRRLFISGTLCSDGQRKAYPWRYAYPWIMILLFLFVSMTILVATEFDAAVLRGRFTERRRKQMLYIFGVVVIAILVFLPPPIDLLALAIHPFFF